MFRKVLLVQDDNITRASISDFLRNEGFEVAEARHCAQATQLTGTDNFDVVITEFLVPHVDGLKLIWRIQSRSSRTPVMLISGHLSPATGSPVRRGGGRGEFRKKPQLGNLAATLRAVLRK